LALAQQFSSVRLQNRHAALQQITVLKQRVDGAPKAFPEADR
jgi:hypothetical protein